MAHYGGDEKRSGGEMEMMTFVHLFENSNQVSFAVLAILDDVFGQLKAAMPGLLSTDYLS